MANVIRFYEAGGPDVLRYEQVATGAPGINEVLVKHEAVGLNFSDVYSRKGAFPTPIPGGLGNEAAGVVLAVGEGVTGFAPGDRVAIAGGPQGAYADERVVPVSLLFKLPDNIASDIAAAMMIKGLTVQALIRQAYQVKAGDTILLHAAAGGIGLIATQWAKSLGATVIGTVSSQAKADLAKANGADHVLVASANGVVEDLGAQVKALTGGLGANVVYDGVGATTFEASLDSLRPLGLMVCFGNSSGPAPSFNPMELLKRGSLFLTRLTVAHYLMQPGAAKAMSDELFKVVADGKVKIHIGQRFALKDAAAAHKALEARQTTGSTILIP